MNLLPKEIISTVLCYVVCGDYEDEGSEGNNRPVDIAVCNSSGYLLEIFNKKIINSCYILIEDASKIQIYYKFIGDSCKVYYLVKNYNGVMIVVRKSGNVLLVVKCFRNVKNFKIFDYKKKGYPQIGMYYFNSDKLDIKELSEFDNIKLSGDNYICPDGKKISRMLNSETTNNEKEDENIMEVDEILHTQIGEKVEDNEEEVLEGDDDDNNEQEQELEKVEDKSIIKEYLVNKLKGMENFQNELNYELDNLNLMINNGLKGEYICPAPRSSANNVPSEKVITIQSIKTWSRIHNSKWIIGFEFWRSGIRNANDIKVLVRTGDFSTCTYKFMEMSDTRAKISSKTTEIPDRDRTRRTNSLETDLIPDTHMKSVLIFALEIPDFGDNSKLSVGFSLVYEKYQYHTETFHLGAEDLFHDENHFFKDNSEMALSEDVLACLMISRSVEMTLEMRYDLGVSLEDVLTENLGFRKAEVLGRSYYIKENGYLSGTLISFERLSDSFIKWKLSVAVKDLPRLKIFVKALSNELPHPLRIRIDRNISTESGA